MTELLVVISIISLLMPSPSQARGQAKSVHCLARLKEFGNALAAYDNMPGGTLPPALGTPAESNLETPAPDGPINPHDAKRPVACGWSEILFAYVYGEEVRLGESYPVQRDLDGRRVGIRSFTSFSVTR